MANPRPEQAGGLLRSTYTAVYSPSGPGSPTGSHSGESAGTLGNASNRASLGTPAGNLLPRISTRRLSSSRFLAVSGGVRYRDDPADALYTEAVRALDASGVDLLGTHCPPAGCNDDSKVAVHQGINALDPHRAIVTSPVPAARTHAPRAPRGRHHLYPGLLTVIAEA